MKILKIFLSFAEQYIRLFDETFFWSLYIKQRVNINNFLFYSISNCLMKTFFCSSIYTLIYETGLTKNFVISLNLPSFSLFTELFAYVVFLWLGICVEVATDRISPISLENFL